MHRVLALESIKEMSYGLSNILTLQNVNLVTHFTCGLRLCTNVYYICIAVHSLKVQ